MSLWAGRILTLLGVLHLVALGAQNTAHVDDWFSGSLWGLPRDEFVEPSGANGAFWITIASFAVPLLLLGALISHLARQGSTVPQFVGWGLAAWCAVGSVILVPTPLPLALIPAALLIREARRVRGQGQ